MPSKDVPRLQHLALKGERKTAVLWLHADRMPAEGLESLMVIGHFFNNFRRSGFDFYMRNMQKTNRYKLA